MNSLLDDDEDDPPAEREVTLGTGTILAIFFGLVLLCGLFFGFGYKMGSHKPTPPALAAAPETSPASAATFDSFKPAAGSPVGAPSPAPAPAIHPPAPVRPSDATPEPQSPPAAAHPPTTSHSIQPQPTPCPPLQAPSSSR